MLELFVYRLERNARRQGPTFPLAFGVSIRLLSSNQPLNIPPRTWPAAWQTCGGYRELETVTGRDRRAEVSSRRQDRMIIHLEEALEKHDHSSGMRQTAT